MKKKITAKEKAKVTLEALLETDTTSSLATKYSVHPVQIGKWKKEAKESLYTIFEKSHSEQETIKTLEKKIDELHRIIGMRDEELSWLKKKVAV